MEKKLMMATKSTCGVKKSNKSNSEILKKLKSNKASVAIPYYPRKASHSLPYFGDAMDDEDFVTPPGRRPTLTAFKKRSTIFKDKTANRQKSVKSKQELNAMTEIQKYQRTTECLIPRRPFMTLVRETMQKLQPTSGRRIQVAALEALQQASEAFLVSYMEDANLLANHSKRITIQARDIILARRIRREI